MTSTLPQIPTTGITVYEHYLPGTRCVRTYCNDSPTCLVPHNCGMIPNSDTDNMGEIEYLVGAGRAHKER
jgi:hypothetical protein